MLGLNCERSAQLVSNSLDQELHWTQRILLKLHLMLCHTCREYANQMQYLHDILYHFPHPIEEDTTIKLPLSVKKRIYDSLN